MEFFGMDFSCAYGSLRNGSIPDKDCLLPLLSKILGYCIVAASTTVKLPQILKILKHKSVRGLSALAFELEVVGYTIGLAYCLHKGMPFSAFGELAFLLVQAIILVAVIYYFSQPLGAKTWIRPLIYCAVAPTILAGKIDPVLFEALYASQHAIFFFARLPQIWANFRSIYGMSVGPNCHCGKGRMKLWRARTTENKGCQFYRCPDLDDHKKCFIWVDELEKDDEGSKTKRPRDSDELIETSRSKEPKNSEALS